VTDAQVASDENSEDGDSGDTESATGDSVDTELDRDAASDVEEGELLEVGETCFADAECDSSLCLFFEAGIDEGICSWFCADEDQCPDEYDCIFVRTTGSDIAKLCVPETLCIDHDDDDYGAGPGCLGRDCDDEDALINPGQFELCDGFDNDCDGTSDVMPVDVGQVCDTGNPGICAAGRTDCDPNRGALFCIPDQSIGIEVCDGVDNDCDGLTDEDDEGEPISMSCYYGAEGTAGVGECEAGLRTCSGGFLQDCLNQVIPIPELCDGLDNNCNNEVDEGNPQEGVRCETGLDGVCGIGLTNCPVEGELECVASQEPGELEEICNLQDDDCDGLTDEDDEGEPLTRDCYYGPEGTLDEEDPKRLCRMGVESCDEGVYRVCEGQVLPSVELCNGFDDDCDGVVDNDPIDVGTTCETDLHGVCGVGLIGCLFGSEEPRACTPLHDPFELEEVCNGMDDDCDGDTDEDGDGEPLTQSCYFGPPDTLDAEDPLRICRPGVATCGDGLFQGCVGQVLPRAEVCNGIDDDCDGVVDNDPTDAGLTCSTGLDGVCATGVSVCTDDPDEPLVCVPAYLPDELVEECNRLDDDCDGFTDEGDDEEPLERTCYYGPDGTLDEDDSDRICQAGIEVCADGFYQACEGQVLPTLETCNLLDDDCNGEVDDDPTDGDQPCSTGFDGVCATGVSMCTDDPDDPLVCVATNLPGDLEEQCNLLDDDCDGFTDEGEDEEALERSCYYGPEDTLGHEDGVCQAGTEVCADGFYQACEGQVLPGPETCNNLDDDCNGEVDDNPTDGDQPCSTGLLGVCATGVSVCTNNPDEPLVCVPTHERDELVEECNRLDDDCDGLTDEGADEEPLERSCYYGPDGTLGGDRACTAGIEVCADGFYQSCEGQILPSPETCNGEDDNCDNMIDNEPIDIGSTCETGLDGVCGAGLITCNPALDEPRVCTPSYVPFELEEVCNGDDDDCDGHTDEDEAGDVLSQSCYFGSDSTLDDEGVPRGICRAGTATCDDGVYEGCVGQILATAETCNLLDDDCDGEPDNDPIDVNLACSTGEHGVCATGVTVCTGDDEEPLQCVPAYTPFELTEECNLLDDDCDGFTDEGPDDAPLERSCYYGPAGTLGGIRACSAGIEVCTDGFYQACEGQVLPSTEVCNRIDDNCDNLRDNDPIDVGSSCDTGHPGVCKLGITSCVDEDDPIVCVASVVTYDRVESCNGFDDDCDGETDEDTEGDPLARSCYDGPEGTLLESDPDRRCRSGVQTCDGGDYSSCIGQLLPIAEICNDIDDNCNGDVDEGDPGSGVQCDTLLDGVCAAGVTSCDDGDIVCNQLIESSDEVCDGFDNNCNGEADEGDPGADETCATGELGICTEGTTSCEGGRLLCNRINEPLEDELCNLLDDNCNGDVDEDFKNEDGVYDEAQWCGNCFTNCLTIFAKDNAHGECNTDGDSPACEMVCEEGFFDLNNVPDDGCEFELETNVIYVSPLGIVGDDCGLGPEDTVAAANEPCQTIEAGLARAIEEERTAVHVADGEYDEAVILEAGIDLLGGYRSDTWERHEESTGTAIRAPQGAGHRRAVTAVGINEATVFEGFTIYAANATTFGTNSYGIYVHNSNNQLTIRKNNIIAGMGGPGADGTDGISGENGFAGGDGDDTVNVSSCTIGNFFTGRAGAAADIQCADPETRVLDTTGYTDAGDGGAPACPYAGVQSEPGDNGAGFTASDPFWGLGGDGGWGHYVSGGCTTSGSAVLEVGLPGYPGEPATDGPGGTGCLPGEVLGHVVDDDWVGYSGLIGGHGVHGRGGGGGGSGGGQYLYGDDTFDISGGGGAGGSGGCAGQRGQPGNPGGGSFGVFVLLSAGASSTSDVPRVTGNSIVRNYGGDGGDGGIGGTGGEGGAAGRGGEVVPGTYSGPAFCIFPGAGGGEGSRGGHGGGGGGACGGVSADIAIFNRSSIDHSTQISGNTFPIADAEPTGGSFGSGGNSSNPAEGEGDDGLAGSSGNVLFAD